MQATPGATRERWFWLLATAMATAAALLVGGVLRTGGQPVAPGPGLPLAAVRTEGAGSSAPPWRAEVPAAAAVSLDSTRTRLFVNGSLAGAEVAGGWCVASAAGAEVLQPCPDLRRRFDHYLLGLGEVTAMDLRSLVFDEVRRAHGEALAGQVLAVWDRYLSLAGYAWSSRFDPADPGTWQAALAEQRQVRRQVLGEGWARAFFADEEQHLEARLAQAEAGAAPPADPGAAVPQAGPDKDAAAVLAERTALYGDAAARRLAQVDAEWADWESRLGAARSEWQRLQQANHLSDLQRHAEMAQYVQSHFTRGEHLRVKALLQLPDL